MNRAVPRRRLGALVLLLASCASPEPEYHRLSPVPGRTRSSPARVIELRRIGLPGYLDRSEIVRGGSGTRLEVLRNIRWGEPLGDMLGRVLAQNIEQRLPGTTVFNDTGAVRLTADVVVDIEVQRFEANQSGVAELHAQVAIRPRQGRPGVAQSFRFASPVDGPGAPAVVAAMSGAVGQLADAVAGLVLARPAS